MGQMWPDEFILQPDFVTKVLLEHSTPISLCIVFTVFAPQQQS